MSHVRFDQMPGCESAAKTEFTGKDAGSYYARKLSCVVARIRGVSATDSKEI